MIVAQTDRLTLRHVEESDAGSLHAVFGDAEVMRYGAGAQTVDWVRAWISQTRRHYEERGYGLWAVTLCGRAEAIGYCGLTWYPDINGRQETEIGYRLAREYWNRGFATEAALAVRDVAFGRLALPRLIALIDPANRRSIRVAEKLGMVLEGTVLLEGYSHPDLVYACDRRCTG
jgi:[ribosomal protein S5]-alanine N-acetyltransferase